MYTKGNWKTAEFDDGLRIITDFEHIAKISHIHPDPLRIQQKANAKLIAAAPDLLARLKIAVIQLHELKTIVKNAGLTPIFYDDIEKSIEYHENAIAKAETV
jgi:hypothetical protein